MGNNGKSRTFFEVYKNQGIFIPKIQRDYVQGRKNAQVRKNRQSLMSKIKMALTDNSPNPKRMMLNFVYGYEGNGYFVPIDGQQRLTTLFLLHIYIFARTGSLNELENGKKFRYAARETTNRFFDALFETSENQNVANIVAFLESIADLEVNDVFEERFLQKMEDCAWFSCSWKNDPSIVSCTVMLATIHKQFVNGDINDLENVKKRLTEERRITFMQLDITQNIGRANQLYIRMNARGKQLTAFENFKADIYGYLEKIDIDIKQKLVENIDGEWLSFLWGMPGEDKTAIDIAEKYCDVFYRELLHWILVDGIASRGENVPSLSRKTQNNKDCFEWLNDSKQDSIDEIYLDDYVETIYGLFCGRKEENEDERAKGAAITNKVEVIKAVFDGVYYTLEGLRKAKKLGIFDRLDISYYEESSGRNGSKKNYGTTVKEYESRAMLYAVKRFMELYCNKFNAEGFDDKFKQWARIMRNLIANSEYDDPQDLLATCRYLNAYGQDDVEKALEGTLKEEGFPFRACLRAEENYKQAIIKKTGGSLYTAIARMEEDKYFNGEILFAFKLANYNDSQDINKVEEALKKVEDLAEVGKNGLLQRALLTYSDYQRTDLSGGRQSYYVYEEKHHNNDFRALLRDKLDCFSKLYEDYCKTTEQAKEFLEERTKNRDSNDESFHYYFITNENVFNYMKAYAYVYVYEDNGKKDVFLLESSDRDKMVDFKIFALAKAIGAEFKTDRKNGYYSYIEIEKTAETLHVGHKGGTFVNKNKSPYLSNGDAITSVEAMRTWLQNNNWIS